MADAYTISKAYAPHRENVKFVAKTKQELVELCATNPENPVAKELMNGIAPFWDEKIFYVLPVSLEAIRTNQNVTVRSRAETVDGQTRVVKEHVLVPLETTEPEVVNE